MGTIATTALAGFFLWAPFATGPFALGSTVLASSTPDQQQAIVLPTYSVGMTGYNAVPAQTDGDPYTTASGAYSDPDVVAARSQDLAEELPFGTVIEVEAASSSPNCGYDAVGDSIGLRVIADTMNPRMHRKIDVLFGRYKTAWTLGVCRVTIKVVGMVDIRRMPRSQDDLRLAIGYLPSAGKETLAISK